MIEIILTVLQITNIKNIITPIEVIVCVRINNAIKANPNMNTRRKENIN
jgi:hypothetical protein